MNLLSPTRHSRLNEAVGFLLLLAGLALMLALASYSPLDPSWDTATATAHTSNLMGRSGARFSDFMLQTFGAGAFLLPFYVWLLGWKWICSSPFTSVRVKLVGAFALWLAVSSACGLIRWWHPLRGGLAASGVAGMLISDYLISFANPTGAAIITAAWAILALYLMTTFEIALLKRWFQGPIARFHALMERWSTWREERRKQALARAQQRAAERGGRRGGRRAPGNWAETNADSARPRRRSVDIEPETAGAEVYPIEARGPEMSQGDDGVPPFDLAPEPGAYPLSEQREGEIPIRPLEEPTIVRRREISDSQEEEDNFVAEDMHAQPVRPARVRKRFYKTPATELLNEPPGRSGYDGQELKEVAGRIKSKLEEFNVRGSVVQINPGPVVTTFEYKPEAGVKYSRITTLSEDLCLGLQAESVLIERLPGKPTIGIEVPNTKREVISLREILESSEFHDAQSRMTIALGKDINGRIKVAPLETMPHLLIAGSTGSGKSVMLNAMIMSFLYKATPDEVRMIMVDPKRVELGIYEGIPHLLTPVITEPKKATNALRNAVLEMERRLKLLASQGVRNIDQFNKKVAQLRQKPMNLFDESVEDDDELRPLPYILILIDELADLMMLERANVEECITRLAQMARAVGMHLVLATQRPSVDVITGIIKANFPSRISFRVATRVDSRTVLDIMGAEHLLGKGDMLYLPPGSSRLTRVHGAFVTENEITKVVDFWKEQAQPEYDQSYLMTPPSEEEDGETEVVDGEQDPMYEDAVRIVLEMGKASTSTLQRRLRLGYGRAARILDMMQRDGIIGPPDGSRPREVLKRPDWLQEVESQFH
jgi:DNA segregation ATPase FtsK/SpoIIIE, S-DNA-T family